MSMDKTLRAHITFSSFPDTTKLFIHGMYVSTLPVCMQQLFAALCVPLGCGFVLGVWLPM